MALSQGTFTVPRLHDVVDIAMPVTPFGNVPVRPYTCRPPSTPRLTSSPGIVFDCADAVEAKGVRSAASAAHVGNHRFIGAVLGVLFVRLRRPRAARRGVATASKRNRTRAWRHDFASSAGAPVAPPLCLARLAGIPRVLHGVQGSVYFRRTRAAPGGARPSCARPASAAGHPPPVAPRTVARGGV